MNDLALFAAGSAVFFIGGAGILLALLDQFRKTESPADRGENTTQHT